jgi:hypothetical protein
VQRDSSDVSPGQLQLLRAVLEKERRRRPSPWLLVVAAGSVIVLVLGIVFAVLADGRDPETLAGQPGPKPSAGPSSSTRTVDYLFRVVQQIAINADGQVIPNDRFAMTMRDYVSPTGAVVSFRTGQQRGCFRFPGPSRVSLARPTQQFLATLPTEVDALGRYIRAHARGSSTRDEAVFEDVADALRQMGWFATTRLRAAMVAVLGRTPGVSVHENTQDALGRPAVRVDFVDQRIRPGHVHALYLEPGTFTFLEDRDSANGAPTHYSGPSPAYGAPAPGSGVDPERLPEPSYVTIVMNETLTGTLTACHH